ncbi:MAG: hypothetical protein [Circoviridae sp.]|nr:MAG: hypothetical protein [Circoviridae sp.]
MGLSFNILYSRQFGRFTGFHVNLVYELGLRMQRHLVGAASANRRLQAHHERISPRGDNSLRSAIHKFLLANMLKKRVHRALMCIRHIKRLVPARRKRYFRRRLAIVKNNCRAQRRCA